MVWNDGWDSKQVFKLFKRVSVIFFSSILCICHLGDGAIDMCFPLIFPVISMLVPFLLLVSSGPGQRILVLVHLRPQSPRLTAHVLPNGYHCQELLSEIPTCLHVCSFWTQPVSIA